MLAKPSAMYRDMRDGRIWLARNPDRRGQRTGGRIPGQKGQHGLWIYEGYAKTTDGRVLQANKDGIIWFEGHGHALSRIGCEWEFTQHRPPMGAQRSIVEGV